MSSSWAQPLWPVGVAIAFVGSLGGAIGDNLVRLEYMRAGPTVKPLHMFKRWKWIMGMLMTTVMDVVCTLTALIFAPATVVTPFAGVHIFWNIFLAKFWVHEQVGLYEICGSGAVIVGVVVIVIFAGKETKFKSLDDLGRLLETPEAIAYIAVMVALTSSTIILSEDCTAKRLPCYRKQTQRLAVAASSGFLGGNTNVSAKALMVVGSQLFSGDRSVLQRWETYFLVFVTIALAVSQLVYLNIGLRRYEAIYIVPTTNSCLIAAGAIGAILILKENPENIPAFFVGLLAVVAGILALTITHTSRDWTKMGSHTVSDSMDLSMDVPSEGGIISQAGTICSSGTPEATAPVSIYRQISQQISQSFSLTASSFSSGQIALNPQALHAIQSMQEIHHPERADFRIARTSQILGDSDQKRRSSTTASLCDQPADDVPVAVSGQPPSTVDTSERSSLP